MATAKTLWLPNVERMLGPHRAGGAMVGGPPRMVHHITWDALGSKGERPPFKNVARYLVGQGYEPHLMIDPILGTAVQFLPFNRAAYALRNLSGGLETNRIGDACIQVEWFFSPNCVVNGKKYATLKDTPMRGLDAVLAVCKEYGIPAEWPDGEPTWKSNRVSKTWSTKAGHYGHCQVPENTHTDPGPMSLGDLPTPQPKEYDDMLDPKDIDKIVSGVVAKLGAPRPQDHSDPDPRFISNGDVLTGVEKAADAIVGRVVEALNPLTETLSILNDSLQNYLAALPVPEETPTDTETGGTTL